MNFNGGVAALASLYEGGGSPSGLTEGVSYNSQRHSPSQKSKIFASPLTEGARGVAGRRRYRPLQMYLEKLLYLCYSKQNSFGR